MENNQNTNVGGENKKWGWCPTGKWGKIFGVIILIIIVIFIGKMICGGCDKSDRIVNTITVSGKGEVVVKPDIATVSFGVSAENLDVSKAQTESATKMNDIIDLLKTEGINEKDIKTTNYNIYPKYDYIKASLDYYYGGKQVLVGYVVSQTVEVKIRDISKAGAILSGVGKFGATDVSGLSFTVDNQDIVKDQARDLAIQDAKTQAKVLAKGLGVKLVKITSFSESGNYPTYYGMEKSMAAGMSNADVVVPQILTGENKITSNVSITYEIK